MTTLHLDEAQADVTLSLSYGDLLAIEDAGNSAIRIDAETGDRRIDGGFITARRNALLSTIPKQITYAGQPSQPLPLDLIRQLSVKDGRALEEAVSKVYAEAVAVNDETSPKGSTSKKR